MRKEVADMLPQPISDLSVIRYRSGDKDVIVVSYNWKTIMIIRKITTNNIVNWELVSDIKKDMRITIEELFIALCEVAEE